MVGDFEHENEMYQRIKDWLVNEFGCDRAYHNKEASFTFTPADKGYIPDVIGRRKDKNGVQYIGVEAKNLVRDSQKIFNQSVTSLAFSNRAFLALPKRLFDAASEELKERIQDRAVHHNVGVLLVLKTKVDVLVPAPSQKFNQRVYGEVGRFFEKLDDEVPYYDAVDLWTETQGEQFIERFQELSPRSFDINEDDIWSGEHEEGVFLVEISAPYQEEVVANINIHPDKVQIETVLETNANELIAALVRHYSYYEFDSLFEVYTKKPKTWERFGLMNAPYCEMELGLDKEYLSENILIRLGRSQSNSNIFNLASMLQNRLLSLAEYDEESWGEHIEAKFSIQASFVRETWQKAMKKNEYRGLELIHELIEASSKFLSFVNYDDSDD